MSEIKSRAEIGELISGVRDRDQEAFEVLLDVYKPLLDAAVSRFGKDELSKQMIEDLRQEATLVFYNAILNYDLENDEVEFGLYAKICVSNALKSQMRDLNKRRAERSVSEPCREGRAEELSAGMIEQEDLKRIDLVIRESLSKYEYSVWCLYASGRTAKKIGEMLGSSEKSVTNAICRIRRKLRTLLG